MAAESSDASGFAPVLTALATMQSNVAGREKTEAHEFLEKFQKSVGSRKRPSWYTYSRRRSQRHGIPRTQF
jgi:hypothetical protein